MLVDDDENSVELEEDNLNNNPDFFLRPVSEQCDYVTTYHDLQTICEKAVKWCDEDRGAIYATLARVGKAFHPNEYTMRLHEISRFSLDKTTYLFTLTPRGYLYIYSDDVKTMYLTTYSGETHEYNIDRYDAARYVRWSADGRFICVKMNNIRHMIDFEEGRYYMGLKGCTAGFMEGIPGYLRFETAKASKTTKVLIVSLVSELRPFQRRILEMLDFVATTSI